MNPEQMKGILRALTPVIAGVLGYFLSDANAAIIAAGIVGAISAIWAAMTHTEANAISVVGDIAQEPGSVVKGVILKPTKDGAALDKETPNTVALAGSARASTMAANSVV